MTLKLGDNGIGYISVENDIDSLEQIWEVLPYDNKDKGVKGKTGIVLRSKVLYYENEVGKPLYLNYKDGVLSVSTERNEYTDLSPMGTYGWTRFGNAYMAYNEWTHGKNNDVDRTMDNYKYNKSIGIRMETEPSLLNEYGEPIDELVEEDTDEAKLYSNIVKKDNYNLLCTQYGGNFPDMKFVDSNMSKVNCEVMAVYNALALAGEYDYCNNSGRITNDLNEYFKSALEFELSDLMIGQIITTGTLGSNPHGIERCLASYNLPYTVIDKHIYNSYTDVCNSFDAELMLGKSGIISYRCSLISKIYLPIHTYAAVYNTEDIEKPILAFNRFSNQTSSRRYVSTDDAMRKSDNMGHYIVGYIIY